MKFDENFEEVPIPIDEPIYPSGVVSKVLDIPMWVLKQLDEEGIVSPPREKGKSRLYSKRELKVLQRVWYYMKDEEVKIEGVKIIMMMEMKIEKLERKLGEKE